MEHEYLLHQVPQSSHFQLFRLTNTQTFQNSLNQPVWLQAIHLQQLLHKLQSLQAATIHYQLSLVFMLKSLYESNEVGDGRDGDVLHAVFQGRARIAGGDVYLLHLHTLRQTPSQCMLATAVTDD